MAGTLKLTPIKKTKVSFRIRGISPLIQHAWNDKAKEQMRLKHAGKKSKTREIRNPEQEARDAAYYTQDGEYGAPVAAIKSSIVAAAHKDLGIEKTLVRKALFFPCSDRNNVIRMECSEPEMREDCVRVGVGSTDLRYRPYFFEWAVDLEAEFDSTWLQTEDLITLVDRAGFGVGIGEWRPEKGGEYGRFEVDRTQPVEAIVIED